jgi:hypothetical protein
VPEVGGLCGSAKAFHVIPHRRRDRCYNSSVVKNICLKTELMYIF